MTLSTVLLAFCENCTWEILPMLIGAWLLGWLFWWLLNRPKYQKQIDTLESEKGALHAQLSTSGMDAKGGKDDLLALTGNIDHLKQQNKEINLNLNSLKMELEEAERRNLSNNSNMDALNRDLIAAKKQILDLELQLQACEEKAKQNEGDQPDVLPPVKDDTATPSYAALLSSKDIKIVEGIGPKIESLLNAGGINSWADLASTAPSRIQTILNEAGPRYRVHDPKSWPQQARLAYEDKWEELIALQKTMGGNKPDAKQKSNQSKVEKLYMKAMGIKAFAPDDLKIVEGIGPKIEGLLKADGINDWETLAAAKLDFIKGILAAAGERYRLADPSTWPKQAGLAAAGKWEELKAYQDRLKGGKE